MIERGGSVYSLSSIWRAPTQGSIGVEFILRADVTNHNKGLIPTLFYLVPRQRAGILPAGP